MLSSIFRRSVVLLLIAVVVGTSVISAFMPRRAYADGADGSFIQSTANSAVLDHQLYYMLTVCFGEQDIDKVTSSELQNWRIFHRSGEDQGATRGAMYDNETISCGNDEWAISEAFGRFGFTDPVKTFCSLDIAYNRDTGGLAKGDSAQDCIDGLNVGDFDAQGDRGKQLDAIQKLLKSTSKGEVAAGKLTDAQEYIRKYRTLVKGCDLTLQRQLTSSEVDSGDNPAAHDDQLFDVTVVNQDGTIEHWLGGAGSDNNSDTTVRLVGKATTGDYPWYDISCIQLEKDVKSLADKYADYLKSLSPDDLGDGVDQGGLDSGGNDASINATCGATDDGFFKGLVFWANPLNWLICPLITGMTALTRVLDNQIVGMLCINEQDVFTGISAAPSTCGAASDTANTTSAGYKSAWNVFRILSLGLLAIAALIMVLSQTSGFEIVDAYTIRKTLPRILIAGIGITLSWALLQWFVGLTNDLGVGVRGLIYSPFASAVGDGQVVLAGGGGAIGKLLASAYLISLGAFGFLTLLATGALAVIIAFAVLTVRNMLVVILLITAPIAIAAYVLPNTQNIWKTWWSFFSKALMVFPIITAFIAIGHVFAALSVKQGGLFNSLIGFAAYFAPYFLLPATFRFAGGAIATIGGFANDRGRGAFDTLKNKRKAVQADRFNRAQNGSLWDPNSLLNRKMGANKYLRHVAPNSLASWATDPLSNAAYYGQNVPGLKKKGRGVAYAIDSARAEQTMKLFEEINKFGDNDKAYRALTGEFSGFSGATQQALRDKKLTGAPTSISDLQTITDVLSKSDSETERTAAAAIGGSMGRLATLYQDGDMTKASIQGAGLLGLSAHGFASGQDIAQTANSLMDSGGSMGFANAIAQQSQVLVARSRPDAKAGYGTVIENGRFVSGVQASDGQGGTLLPKDANGNVDTAAIEAERAANGEVNSEYLGARGFEVLKAVGPGDIAGAKGGMLRGVEKSGISDHLRYILKHGDSDQARGAKARLATMSDEQKKSAQGRELKRLANAAELYVPMRDQLLQSASYYSHASSDIKSNAAEILRSTGHEQLVAQYDANRSAGHDPSAHEDFPHHDEGNEGH